MRGGRIRVVTRSYALVPEYLYSGVRVLFCFIKEKPLAKIVDFNIY